MTERRALLFGVGPIDALFSVPSIPPEGGHVHASSLIWQPGGIARHAAVLSLSFSTEVVLPLTDDLVGKTIRSFLDDYEAIVHPIACNSSPVSFVLSGEVDRTIVANETRNTREVTWPYGPFDLLLSDGHYGRSFAIACKENPQGFSCLDLGQYLKPEMKEGLEAANMVVGHSETFRSITQQNRTEDAIAAMMDRGVDFVVETLEDQGAMGWSCRGEKFLVKAPKVEAIDTTGCRDVFLSVCAGRMVAGSSFEESVEAGVQRAALWAKTSDTAVLKELLS